MSIFVREMIKLILVKISFEENSLLLHTKTVRLINDEYLHQK